MIYELLYPLRHYASWLSWLNVLRYIPFRAIVATITAMLLTFVLAPWFIRELQKKQIGQVVRNGRPRDAHDQGGHADDGRRAHPALAAAPDGPLGRSPEPVRPRDDGGHRRLRRHRLPRRLPQDQAQELGRPRRPLQAHRPVRSSAARSIAYTFLADARSCPPTGSRSARTSRSRSSRSPSTRSICRSGSTCRSRCSSWSPPRTR